MVLPHRVPDLRQNETWGDEIITFEGAAGAAQIQKLAQWTAANALPTANPAPPGATVTGEVYSR